MHMPKFALVATFRFPSVAKREGSISLEQDDRARRLRHRSVLRLGFLAHCLPTPCFRPGPTLI